MEANKIEHGKRLPTIRIQKVILKDFKSVGYGEIIFDCCKHFVPQGTQADILGVYGQNGSGKTSLIEALSILKFTMLGLNVPDIYVNCIAAGAPYAQLEFSFDLQYGDGRIRKVIYSFKLDSVKSTDVGSQAPSDSFYEYVNNLMESENQLRIFDEMIQMSGDFYDEKIKLQTIIDTSSDDVKNPFLPASKRKYFLGNESDELLMEQSLNKKMASKLSRSYIFMHDTMMSFLKLAKESEYVEVLRELKLFSHQYLFVIDTKYIGSIGSNFALPLYSGKIDGYGSYGYIPIPSSDDEEIVIDKEVNQAFESAGIPSILPMMGSFVLDINSCKQIKKQFEAMNVVLEQLIPGMQINLKVINNTMTKNGAEGRVVELITIRDGNEMPFRYESDGVKKIISVLDLIIRAFNQKSTTIAIDEFDSGIFEYLLGEILEAFQEGGRGQFIFTSHNLRPLEVIDKKYLYFTTTNKMNRYVRLKNIGKTNNLRNVYYREIVIGEQDEELYRRTQRYDMAVAFRKAGRINGEA